MADLNTIGRVDRTADGFRLDAPGSGLELRVGAGTVSARLRDEQHTGMANWMSVWLDDVEIRRFRTQKGSWSDVLATIDDTRTRTLRLLKDTEGGNGSVFVESVHAEIRLPAMPVPTRRMEFIGDSITCGYGADSVTHPCGKGEWYDASRASRSYASVLGRRLNAEVALNAISGIGVARNYSTDAPTMTALRDRRPFPADLVVIALGTNDFIRGPLEPGRYAAAYREMLAQVRAEQARASILHVCSPMLEEADEEAQALAYAALGLSPVVRFGKRLRSGCAGHPDLDEHILMADILEPWIRSMMAWDR